MKRFLFPLLIIVNIIGFCILGIIYFYAFDLQWGVNRQAMTWGLPLLSGIVLLLIDTIFMIKKKNWKRGLRGFGIGWAAFIYTGILVWFFSYVLIAEPVHGPKETLDTQENRILTLLLARDPSDGRKMIAFVEPKTNTRYIKDYIYPSEEEVKVDLINKLVEKQGYNETLIWSVNMTFNKFIEINQSSVTLTVKSSIKDGYIIDYDVNSLRYFKSGGSGWERLNLFRRCVGGFLDVTIPAYDSDTGIVIVYLGWMGGPLFGEGGIYVFKFENEKLHFITFHELWVS